VALPDCIIPSLEIVSSDTIKGLERSMSDKVFKYPLLEIQGERFTSKNTILDILQEIAVRMGHNPPYFD